jgi:hypothetical protein
MYCEYMGSVWASTFTLDSNKTTNTGIAYILKNNFIVTNYLIKVTGPANFFTSPLGNIAITE